MMASTVTEAMSGGMNITKIDVDEDQDMSIKYNVRSVPTMVLVNQNNEEVKRVVGLQTLTALKDFYNG
jgi:thioredoxin-like negative regulator of GroEL